MKRVRLVSGVVVVLILIVYVGGTLFLRSRVKIPELNPANEVVALEQGWNLEEREWFHHTTQGTAIFPYDWFMALEQPTTLLVNAPLFRSDDYLARFGFLPTPATEYNPDGLPIGFAKDDKFADPITEVKKDQLGFTCAACHTGEVVFNGKAIRIEGGSAMISTPQFQEALKWSFLLTNYDLFRFRRFAKRVLGDDYDRESRNALKKEVEDALKKASAIKENAEKIRFYPGQEGFGRTDALGRIGNFLFGTELNDENLRLANAPVNYPALWDTPWLDWVQYNGSVRQPMVRNIGEALGVKARVNIADPERAFFTSTVRVSEIHAMERLIRGDEPFKGLTSPKWPAEILGPIKTKMRDSGEKLYSSLCKRCHLPPIRSDEIWEPKYWTDPDDNAYEKQFLKTVPVNLSWIGTDPNQAINFSQRIVNLWPLERKLVSVGEALKIVTTSIAEMEYDKLGLSEAERAEWNGYREPGPRAPLAYRPRPLDGIWATAPYLHNGSVPSLYQMLSPVEERDETFYLGSKNFDPVDVGFDTSKLKGGFFFDTRVTGNSNTGHEFKGDGIGEPGVVGRFLKKEERRDLIEFLKTL